MPKNHASSFALAAKILFDSAQKAGAVGKNRRESGQQFARHLQRLQGPGTSANTLQRLSSKVTKFVETQRKSSPKPPINVTLNLGLVTRPPSPSTADVKTTKIMTLKSSHQEVINTQTWTTKTGKSIDGRLNIPSLSQLGSTLDAFPTASPSPTALYPAAAVAKISLDQSESKNKEKIIKTQTKEIPKAEPEEPNSASTDRSSTVMIKEEDLDVGLVLEDQPLFDTPDPMQAAARPNVVASVLPAESRPTPEASEKQGAAASLSGLSDLAAGAETNTSLPERRGEGPHTPVETIDTWEAQREQEVERLEALRAEEEMRRVVQRQREEHRILGEEWVAQRSRIVPTRRTKESDVLMSILHSTGLEGTAKLEQMIAHGHSLSCIATAVAILSHKLVKEDIHNQLQIKSRLLNTLEHKKELNKVLMTVKLLNCRRSDFVDLLHSCSKKEIEAMDFNIHRRAVRCLMIEGLWEEALEIVTLPRYSAAKRYTLELVALRSALGLEDKKKEAFLSAIQSAAGSRRNGREYKLLILQLENRGNRVPLLKQAVTSPEADERTFSALIYASHPKECGEIVSEVKKRGLSPDDPSIMRALLWKSFGANVDAGGLFDEIQRQKQIIGLRSFHLTAAVRSLDAAPSSAAVKLACDLLMEYSPEHSLWALKKILPKLYSSGSFSDIIRLGDHYSSVFKLEEVLPHGVAFYNEALVKEGRPPLSNLTVAEIGYRAPSETERRKESESREGLRDALQMDISSCTEEMLQLAKDRDWQKSIQILERLPPPNEANSAAMTLLFNCALSSAVETYEVTQRIYSMMKERGVTPNSTTVNTVLSSCNKFSRMEDADILLKEAPATTKDITTHTIYLSMLSKRNRVEDVATTWEEVKKSSTRLPTSLYALVLGTAASHRWDLTLSIFQDMIKVHGKNVNEALRSQVFKCLERNERHTEIAKLTKQLESKRRKK